MNRREFFKKTLGASTLLAFGCAAPNFLLRSAAAATPSRRRETILVVIQLSGGNDGLNTVIPYENDIYHRRRPTLRITPDKVLKLGNGLGLHPDMQGFQRLYDEGHLAIVQGVGYPHNNRNHDGAMRDWHTAKPKDPTATTGWIGQALDFYTEKNFSTPGGVFVGHIEPPFALQSKKAIVPKVQTAGDWAPVYHGKTADTFTGLLEASSQNESQDEFLDEIRQVTLQTLRASRRIESVAGPSAPDAAVYPQYRLAQTLRTIAQLIRAEVGVRIFFAELGGGGIGGFDTHAGQAANHGALLRELSESVTAFAHDLEKDKLLECVLLMTFSEFGRTLTENGRHGTNHGSAAPLFLAGGALKKRLVGVHPRLDDLEEDAPKPHTDFRRVYATALENWLGIESRLVLGESFAPLEGLLGSV